MSNRSNITKLRPILRKTEEALILLKKSVLIAPVFKTPCAIWHFLHIGLREATPPL